MLYWKFENVTIRQEEKRSAGHGENGFENASEKENLQTKHR